MVRSRLVEARWSFADILRVCEFTAADVAVSFQHMTAIVKCTGYCRQAARSSLIVFEATPATSGVDLDRIIDLRLTCRSTIIATFNG